MRKKLYLFVFVFWGIYNFSQKKDSLKYVDLNQSQSLINQDIMVEYLIKRKELTELKTSDKYEDLIITEIYGGVDVNDGICLFKTTKSHSGTYVYLELENGIKILNLNNLNDTLLQILQFSAEKKLDYQGQLKLIKRILELFERKNNK